MADRAPTTTAEAAEQHHGTRLNRWLAQKITAAVGTMTCAYVFTGIALISAPAAIASGDPIIIVGWIAQTFLQLVLLSVIMVGQNVSAIASDARADATFRDVGTVLEHLHTLESVLTQKDA